MSLRRPSGRVETFRCTWRFCHSWSNKSLYDQINLKIGLTNVMTINGSPINTNYKPFSQTVSGFICPSDPNTETSASETNYRYNFGGATPYAGAVDTDHQSTRTDVSLGNGAFTYGTAFRTGDFTDGLSNTAFFSERTARKRR